MWARMPEQLPGRLGGRRRPLRDQGVQVRVGLAEAGLGVQCSLLKGRHPAGCLPVRRWKRGGYVLAQVYT